MAEWTGRRQRQHSAIEPASSPRHQERDETPQGPETPGAQFSPQLPGEVPDRSSVPGQYTVRVPPATRVVRPLTEYGTAQAIMGVYAAKPGQAEDPARFEQATASFEEMRKAYPAQVPPVRPAPGYALDQGDAQASELQAIDGPRPTTAGTEPAVATGEAHNAVPGAEPTAATRTDASAAEIGSAFSPADAPASVRSPAAAAAGTDAVTLGQRAGESRWAEAARPGDSTSPAGTLPAAKEGETTNRPSGDPPPVAAQ